MMEFGSLPAACRSNWWVGVTQVEDDMMVLHGAYTSNLPFCSF